MKLKLFQKQDLARAALHNGLILAWDTGLGKTWAIYLWPLLKVGYTTESLGLAPYSRPKPTGRTFAANAERIRPKEPVLIIAPGDLHQQIVDEGWERFGIAIYPLDCQNTFGQLTGSLHSGKTKLDAQGRPVLPPDYYITSYTDLTTNGVDRIPNPRDWKDPIVLRQLLCLQNGDHVGLESVKEYCLAHDIRWPKWEDRPTFETTCEFFAWRQIKWLDAYRKFDTTAQDATRFTVEASYQSQFADLAERRDAEQAEIDRAALHEQYEIIQNLITDGTDPQFSDLAPAQQDFVLKYFLADFCQRGGENEGEIRSYEKMSDGKWRVQTPVDPKAKPPAPKPEDPVVVTTWRIKCVYSPSLSDLSYNAFRVVTIDEGVKMKGANTYVGQGVRQMDPEYRLVLTATPVKNRVPDLFWLAHWATGGKTQAHARFPYSSDPGDQNTFAETFMVSESVTSDSEKKRDTPKRFKKLTPAVCNIHRLWKLLGPIILRRRKDDCSEDIVPKVRKVVHCKMGTLQSKVYAYHLNACYEDINGDDAIGARLQALRIAAADPTSPSLYNKEGGAREGCRCTKNPVPPEEQLQRLLKLRQESDETLKTGADKKKNRELKDLITRLDKEITNPVQRFDPKEPEKDCNICKGLGQIELPPRSGQAFIPKHASVLNLVNEILERGEQVLIGAAFNDPLDRLSDWLTQAKVRHLKLDGRTSQVKRGKLASVFKRGRYRLPAGNDSGEASYPVMLAGVECMAEGHSFHLANNVILLAYSWAYDKFIQFINRVHRMTSPKPVNVYVVVCDGTIDQRLESMIGEKGDSAELVLDGRLLGETAEEINLAELLNVAHREFDAGTDSIDEALVAGQWPALRDLLATAQADWDRTASVLDIPMPVKSSPRRATAPRVTASKPIGNPSGTRTIRRLNPTSGRYENYVETVTTLSMLPPPPVVKPATKSEHQEESTWQDALRPKPSRRLMVVSENPWDLL